MKKKILLSLLILGLATGCGKIPKMANGDDAVVSFNREAVKEDISVTDLYTEVKTRYALSSLIDMIDRSILLEKYPDKDKEATQDANSQIDNIKQYYVDDNGKYDESKLIQAIQAYYGINTIAEFKEMLKLSYYRDLAVTDYAKASITDKEIKKYYEDEIVGDISAKHILISPNVTDSMTDAEKKAAEEKALKTAKEVIAKLDKGESFDDLAKTYSADESNKDKGGDLGFFNKGTMVEEFEKAAYKLKLNAYTKEPVKTQFGYHIILKTGEKEKESLDAVKDKIIETLAEQKRTADNAYSIEAMAEVRKASGMKIQDSELAKQYETYISNQLINARNSAN